MSKNIVVEKDGNKYTVVELSNGEKLEIRHPKGRDLRVVSSKGNVSDIDMSFSLASTLSCKSEEELEDMDLKDTTKILKVVSGFLQ